MAFYDSDSDNDVAFNDPNQAMALAVAHWRARGLAGNRSSSKRSIKESSVANCSAASGLVYTDVRRSPAQLRSPPATPQQPERSPRVVSDGQLLAAPSTLLPMALLSTTRQCTLLADVATMKSLPPLPVGHHERDGSYQHQQHTIRPIASSSELFQRLRRFRSMLSFSGAHRFATAETRTPRPPSVSRESVPTHRTSSWSLFAMKRAATTNSPSVRKESSFRRNPSPDWNPHAPEKLSRPCYEMRRGVSSGADSTPSYPTISSNSQTTSANTASRRTTITTMRSTSTPTSILISHSPAASQHVRTAQQPFGDRQQLADNLFGSILLKSTPLPPAPVTMSRVYSPYTSARRHRSFDLWINPSRARGCGAQMGAKSFDLDRCADNNRVVLEDDANRAIEFWPQPIPPAGVPASAAVATRSPLTVAPIAYEYCVPEQDMSVGSRTARAVTRNSAPPVSNLQSQFRD
ncbi:hypothetical protein HDU84_004136 [Entophlyctis sp. JEL0112]|nr:hypothetical protein HDU84_004136 [Entophlyctis sp. JEL0112]